MSPLSSVIPSAGMSRTFGFTVIDDAQEQPPAAPRAHAAVAEAHDRVRIEWVDQWGETNANLSGIALTLYDPAVGVGAAVAIGALVYGVLLRRLPYPRPDRIVEVTLRTPGYDGGREYGHSQATFVHFRDGATSLAAFGGHLVNDAVTLTDLEDPQRITAVMITTAASTISSRRARWRSWKGWQAGRWARSCVPSRRHPLRRPRRAVGASPRSPESFSPR